MPKGLPRKVPQEGSPRPCQFWRVFQRIPKGLSRKVPQERSPRPCQFWRVFQGIPKNLLRKVPSEGSPRPCRFRRVPRRFPRWAGSCGVGLPRTFPQGSPKASRRSPRIGRAMRAEAFKGMVGLSKGHPRLPEDAPLVGFDWYWLDLGSFWVALA